MHRGECVTTGGLYRPTPPVCSTLELQKKKFTVFDLLFSAGGESVGAVVPSWRVTWCWWSR